MGLSINTFTYAGVTDFDLNFALGYTSKQDISCVKTIEGFPVAISFEWLTDNKVRISTEGLELGDELNFYRTVSKTTLPVDLTVGSEMTRENVEVLHRHAIYVMHEIFDGRFDSYSEIDASTMEIVTDAVRSAIRSSGLLATYKYPVQLSWSGTTDIWPTSNMESADVRVIVTNNPLSPQEFLITGDNGVIADFTVDTSGEVTLNTYEIESGERLELSTVTDHGASVKVVVEGILSEYLEFSEEFPDFAEQFRSYTCL